MTRVRSERYTLPGATLGPENPLPMFCAPEDDATIGVAEGFPEEDRKRLGWRCGFRVLPYRMQDSYSRARVPRSFAALVLENEYLRATFLPELGGRLVSLIDKPGDRELLDRNPVFQPANLAIRNAWFSGGIEWNAGRIGHHHLTCSPVHAVSISTGRHEHGLRLFEWDRVTGFPWQIDFHLPSTSRFLFAHVRLSNTHDHEIPMYWWTNMAVRESPEVRVVVPAASAIHNDDAVGFGLMDLPMRGGCDVTYPTNVQYAREFFYRIPDRDRKWIAAVDRSGKGFVHASTDILRGRKLFCWGMNPGGRRWQEFLSEPGNAYIEIQAGLARTQFEHLPMPAGAVWEWTEAFGAVQCEGSEAHSPDWRRAVKTVENALERALPRKEMLARDRQAVEVAQTRQRERLTRGSGWRDVEDYRSLGGWAGPLPAGIGHRNANTGPSQEPWLNLLETGTLAERSPAEGPGEFMVQEEWRRALERSVQKSGGDHWLAWYHLGVLRMESRDYDGARKAWTRSLEHIRTSWTLRNLAVLAEREGRPSEHLDLLREAWEAGPQVVHIAIEFGEALAKADRWHDLRSFVRSCPQGIADHERLQLCLARACVHTGDYAVVEEVLARDFATIREGEASLTDLWFSMHEHRLAGELGVAIDSALRERVRRQCPPAHHIDFRMSREA